MKKYLKRGLSGALSVMLAASAVQFNVLYTGAKELVEELTAEISDGDVNGDGKTDSTDVTELAELLGSSVGSIDSSGKLSYNVYRDDFIDVKDLMAAKQLSEGGKPTVPEDASSGNSCRIEVTDAECCPGEQVKVDVNIIDWDQELGAVELMMDFDDSLEVADISCKGDYQYVLDGNELKIFGITSFAEVYRGTVATLTFNVPDTAYGDYDVKILEGSVYDERFRKFDISTKVGLIAADVTERPLYLSPSYTNSESLRLSWSMPYCSGSLEGYIVYRDGEEIARTTEPWYYDENLVTGQKYVYAVQAYGAENYLSAKSKTLTAAPKAPVISAVTFPDNASEIGGKSTYVKCSLENTVEAKSYSLTYVDAQGETQTIYSSSDLAFSAVDIKWNIGSLPSGDYDLTFTVTDKDGASATKTVSVTVDTTPPEEIFGFDVYEDEQKTHLTWGIAAEAKVVGYNIYRRTETGAYTLHKYIEGRETLEYTDENLEEGDVYFYMMCAVDKYGQEGIYSEEKSAAAKGDETSPEMTLFLPESGNVLSRFVTISLKAEDNIGVSSIAAFISEDDGATWNKLFEGKGSSVNYSFDTTAYDEAQVKIKAVAYDYAGNESDALVQIYAIDNKGPAAVENIRSVSVTAVTATIGWDDVPDDDFSYFNVRYGKTGDENVKTTSVYGTLGVNLTNLSPDTEYTVSVAAVDIYGNTGEYSEPFTFTTASDTVAPAITSIRPEPYYYSTSIPLVVTAQDDFSVSKVVIQTAAEIGEEAEWTNAAVIENTGSGQYFNPAHELDLSGFSDGKIYVRAYAEDIAGNVGEPSPAYEYIVDKTAPEAPVSLKASSDASEIQLIWQAHENNIDSVYFSLYRSSEEDGEYTKILDKSNTLNYYDRTAEPGNTYYYRLTAIDAAGNESEMSEAVSAVLEEDTAKPEVVSISPADGSMVSNVYNKVSALVRDNVKVDSVTMEYRLSEEDEYTSFLQLDDVNSYYTVAEGTLPRAALAGESVQIRIGTVDASGNASDYSEVTYTVNNDVTDILTASAEQLEDCIKVAWTAAENDSTQGYYIYKKINNSDWQKIAAVTYDSANEGAYSFEDTNVYTAGTVTYKIESSSVSGIKDTLQAAAIQVYTNPEASLDVEPVQQQNVEYIFDASGCNDYYGITDVSIDFGDGSTDSSDTAESAKFIHKYTKTGKYTVTLTCTNEQGLTSTIEQPVEVIERTLMGESTVTVKTTEGKAAAGIFVYVDIGTERQTKLKTDNTGSVTFKTAAGIHTIGVYGDGYLPTEKDCTILAGSGNKFDFTVVEEDIVTADFTVERMTLDEIVAAGIDITAPENQHIVEVKLDVEYAVHESPSAQLTYYVNSSGQVIGGGGGWGGSWTGGGYGGGSGSGSGSVTKPVYISLNEDNEVETVIMLTVPVSASFLKEFFHAQLTIYNNADKQYTISENEVELMLPEGLTLVDVEASDDRIVTYDVIEGQSSRTIDWIIRGDEAGEYPIEASYHGVLDRFNEEINAVFSTDEPITVYGETAVSVEVNVPEMLYDNQFIFEVAMTNNCPVDVYCPSTDTGTVISSAFGNSGGAKPVIYQRRLLKDGKYIRIINNDEVFDTLEPGYTYSVVYKASGVFTGIDGAGKNVFHSSRLDLIKASIEVLNSSKIPVTLNVVKMIDSIILNEIKTIPDYEPEKQITIIVTSSDTKKYLSGATVTMGSVTKKTGSGGYVLMDIPETAQSIKVSCDGYKSKTVTPGANYDDGLYIVDLETEEPKDDGSGPNNVGNKTDYGNIELPEELEGDPEDDVNEITVMPGTLTFGESMEFEFSDDIPLIGGETLSLGELNLPIEIEVDEEGHTGFSIGLGDFDWSNSDDDDDEDDLVSKYKKLIEFAEQYPSIGDFVDDAKKMGASVNPFNATASHSISADLSFVAAFYGTYDKTKGYERSIVEDGISYEGNIALTFEFEYGFGTQLVVVSIPVAIEVTIGTELTVGTNFEISYKDYKYNFNGNLKLTGEIEAEVFAGVGATGICAAGVYGSAGLGVEYTFVSSDKSEEGLNKITFTYEIGVRAYLGPFKVEHSLVSPDDDIVIYEKPKSGSTSGNSSGGTMSSMFAAIYDKSNYSLMDEVYLNTASTWKGSSAETAAAAQGCAELLSMVNNAAGATMHKLAVVGDKLVLVYLDNDKNRETVNAMRLMYTVYDSESKTWSEPAQIDSNETGDYAPNLWTDGTDLYVIYQDSAAVLDKNADIDSWLASQNIAAAKFDTASMTFGEVSYVTKDTNVLDSVPVITGENGKIAAVWVSNEENDYFGSNGKNKLMYSELGISGWSEPEVLLANLNAVTGLNAGFVNEKFCAVYTIDNDNDLTTTNDRTLNVRRYGENESYEIDKGDISSARFAVSPETGKQTLYWYGNSTIRMTDNLTVAKDAVENAPASISSSFVIAGNRIIWCTGDGKDKSNLFEIVYDAESGSWGGAVRLTEQDMYIENVEAVEFNGEIISVMNRNDVKITEDGVDENNSIVWTSFTGINNITANGAFFLQSDYAKGKKLPVTVSVTNNGESTVKSVTLNVTSSNGTNCGSTTVDCEIRSGESKLITVDVDTALAGKTDSLTVTVSSNIKDETDTADNSVTIGFGFADMSVTTSKIDSNTLSVNVSNNGTAKGSAQLVIYDYATGAELETFELADINAGSSVTKDIDLTKYIEKCKSNIKVSVVCDGDTNEYSNSCIVFSAMDDVKTYTLGDVNEDGSIDASDASQVLAEYASTATGHAPSLSESQRKAADVNIDAAVDAIDASRILAYYASAATGGNPSFN